MLQLIDDTPWQLSINQLQLEELDLLLPDDFEEELIDDNELDDSFNWDEVLLENETP